MKFARLFMALLLSLTLVAAVGCEKEGAAERAGKSLDNMMDKAGDKLKKLSD